MKKILSFLLALSFMLSMAACGADALQSAQLPDGAESLRTEQSPALQENHDEQPVGDTEQEAPVETPQPQTQQPAAPELSYASSYEEVYSALEKLSQTDEEQLRYGIVSDYFASDKNEIVDEAIPEAPTSSGAEYSGTNVQVAGIDEGDIVKTDGEYIYILHDGSRLVIMRAAGADTAVVSTMDLGYLSLSATPPVDIKNQAGQERSASELFVFDDTLAVIYENQSWSEELQSAGNWVYDKSSRTEIEFYDISDPSDPEHMATLGQDGSILGTRLYEGRLYVVTTWDDISYGFRDKAEQIEDLIPALYEKNDRRLLTPGDICICTTGSDKGYILVAAYDMTKAESLGAKSVLGGGNMVYMSGETIYVAGRAWRSGESEPRTEDIYTVVDYSPSTNTKLFRFSVTGSGPELTGSALVPGYLESRFSMDEYDGKLRLVTTVNRSGYTVYIDEEKGFVNFDWHTQESETNSLYILDEDLMMLGSIEDLAEGERVYSARFDGSMAYFCTFEQVDPLFAVDCSDPAAPVVLSALKISGFSEYLHRWSEDQLFGFGYEADESTGWMEGLKMVMFNTADKADVSVENSLHLDGIVFSEAVYDPHAFFIAPEKNIIGFVGDGVYYIYGYSAESGFYKRAEFDFHGWGYNARGLYIGDEIYLLGRDGGYVLDLESCSMIKNLYW